MLKDNYLLEKINNTNEVCFGTFAVIPNIETVDIISSSEIDFIIIDGEHSPVSYQTAQNMVVACESNQTSPVYRVPKADQVFISKALDIGSHAIQLPNVEQINDIENLISYGNYPPEGKRGFSPFTRASGYDPKNSSKIISNTNNNTLLIAQIEGKLGIENLETLLEFKKIDVFFIGLYDLSLYLGLPGQIDHSDVLSLFKSISSKVLNAGYKLGSIANSLSQAEFLINSEVKFLAYSVDSYMLKNSYQNIIKEIKSR